MQKYLLRHFIFILIVAIPVVAVLIELKSKQRSVANIPEQNEIVQALPFDLGSPLSSESTRTIKYRILQELKLSSESNNFKIQLGHFTYRNGDEIIIGCNQFKYIEIILNAEGIANSGSSPKIAFTYPCDATLNPELIESPIIPLGEITQLPISTKDWIDSITQVHYYFISTAEVWPTQWAIFSITFFTPGKEEKLKISGVEIPAVLKEPPTISLE